MASSRPSAKGSSGPRIAPLATSEMDEDQRELLGQVAEGPVRAGTNLFATLVRHPGLFRRWLPLGGKLLLGGRLPGRDRELLILRTAWRCGSDYEWGQHLAFARSEGLSDAEIQRVKGGPGAGWSDWDSSVLQAADELHENSIISESTWASLAERYDEQQLIEVPMLVGHYHMVAYTLRSLGVEREEDVPGFETPAG